MALGHKQLILEDKDKGSNKLAVRSHNSKKCTNNGTTNYIVSGTTSFGQYPFICRLSFSFVISSYLVKSVTIVTNC